MKRLAWIAMVVAMGVGPALVAAEPDTSAIEAQKKDLAAKKKDLQAQQAKIRGEVGKSDALAVHRQAVAEAQKAYQAKLAAEPAIVKARQAQQNAQSKLDALVAAKAAGSSDQAAVDKALAALDAKRADLEYRAGLVDLELSHPGSPVRQKVDADPEVRMLREAAEEAAQKVEDEPSPSVVKARQEARSAAEALAVAEAEALKDPACRKAAEAVRQATAARGKAVADDKRQDAARQARTAHDDARTRAYGRIPEARPLLQELQKTEADLAKVEQDLDSNEAVLAVYREMLASGSDPDTAAVRARVEAARQGLDKAMQDTGLAAMETQLRAAQKARDDRSDLLLTVNPEFRTLLAEQRTLEARHGALAPRLERLSDKEVRDLAQVRARQAAVARQLYQLRQTKWHDPAVEPLWKTADGLYHGLGGKRRTVAAVAEAGQGVQAAERRQATVLDKKAAADPRSRWAIQERRGLLAKQTHLQFQRAVLQYKLSGPRSALAKRVDGDAAVIKARQAGQALEADIRANPAPAVADADRQLAKARADQEAAFGKHPAYVQAAARATEAQKALRAAVAGDPRRKAVAEMDRSVEEKIAAKTQALPEAQDLLKQRAAIEQELAQLRQARSDAARKAGDIRKTVQAGEDAEIIAARKAVEDAAKAVKEAQTSDSVKASHVLIEAAQKALKDAADAAAANDEQFKAIQKQIAEIDAKQKELDAQLRAARQKPKAERPKKGPAKKEPAKKGAAPKPVTPAA